jgi:thymidine phosphorylase
MATVDGANPAVRPWAPCCPAVRRGPHGPRHAGGAMTVTRAASSPSCATGTVSTEAELFWFAEGLATGEVTDSQAGAFAMAVCTRGLGTEGRVQLTTAMRASGDVLKWDLDGPVLDKHSTGGVGDCVSLLLAPALAACGAYVPMISGRGLGHTGGTLDKLEAIPGYRTQVTVEDLQEIVPISAAPSSGHGRYRARRPAALRGARRDRDGGKHRPDHRLDPVEEARRRARGAGARRQGGLGRLHGRPQDALALAEALVKTAQGAGCMTSALITDMNQPLASVRGKRAGGDRGDGGADRWRHGLGADARDRGAGRRGTGAGRAGRRRRRWRGADPACLRLGSGGRVFGEMVAELGGPADFVDRWRDRLPAAKVMVDIHPGESGYVAAIDARAGRGGGATRRRAAEAGRPARPRRGAQRSPARIGQAVDPRRRFYASMPPAKRQRAPWPDQVRAAFTLSDTEVTPPPLIHERIA